MPRLQLYTKVLLGLALGAGVGLLANRYGLSRSVVVYIQPVGTAFVRLISMVVVPLVFASLLVGVTSLKDIRSLGRIGLKTVAFYLCTTAVAVTVGLVLANALRPGVGLSEQARRELIEQAGQDGRTPAPAAVERPSIRDVLLNLIPTNPIRALVEGQMLQVIFFAVFLGICLTLLPPDRSGPLIRFFESVNDVIVKMVHLIMKLAPYGVFALIAGVVADFGLGILTLLMKYCAAVMLALLIHSLFVYSSAVRTFAGLGAMRFFRGVRPAQLIAFSSSSSSATLPVTIECVEKRLGVPRHIASFTLPLGATINMDGTAVYQGVSAVFLAQLYGMDLGVGQQLAVVLTATLASIGTAGTPGAGIVMLAIVLQSIGVPLQGIAVIMGVERILDMCRTVVNVTGDAACAVVVGTSEKPVDRVGRLGSVDSRQTVTSVH